MNSVNYEDYVSRFNEFFSFPALNEANIQEWNDLSDSFHLALDRCIEEFDTRFGHDQERFKSVLQAASKNQNLPMIYLLVNLYFRNPTYNPFPELLDFLIDLVQRHFSNPSNKVIQRYSVIVEEIIDALTDQGESIEEEFAPLYERLLQVKPIEGMKGLLTKPIGSIVKDPNENVMRLAKNHELEEVRIEIARMEGDRG